jgi:hypothetical protein
MVQSVELTREGDVARFTVLFGGEVELRNSLGERDRLSLADAVERIHTLVSAGWRVREAGR